MKWLQPWLETFREYWDIMVIMFLMGTFFGLVYTIITAQ